MVSIMVNKLTYKPSVEDIMDKYYEMFRGKNLSNNKDFFICPDSQKSFRLNEEWVVCERETSLSFIKITQSLIH